MDTIARRAEQIFDSGLRCAESVLLSVAESKGIQSDLIPRIATGFCGGMARTGGTCGAVTGGIMAVNLCYGRNDPQIPIEETYVKVQELIRAFETRFGTTNCRELLNCDLSTPEGRDFFHQNNLIDTCRNFTVAAAQIVAGMI